MKSTIYKVFCLLSLSITLNAQPGSLDESFGTGGKVVDTTLNSDCLAIALQQDGKIITAVGHYRAAGQDRAAHRRRSARGVESR